MLVHHLPSKHLLTRAIKCIKSDARATKRSKFDEDTLQPLLPQIMLSGMDGRKVGVPDMPNHPSSPLILILTSYNLTSNGLYIKYNLLFTIFVIKMKIWYILWDNFLKYFLQALKDSLIISFRLLVRIFYFSFFIFVRNNLHSDYFRNIYKAKRFY